LDPLESLFGAAPDDLPAPLAHLYGGGLDLPRSVVFANFVSSIDGIAALHERPASSSLISGRDEGDRFVMGLLRAAADVVLIGAGTLRDHHGPWTAAAAFPDCADAFEAFRALETRTPAPRLAVVSASGDLDEARPALEGALVLTTARGKAAIPERVSAIAEVEVLGDGGGLGGGDVILSLREHGFERILTEGGPRLMAELFRAGVVDELFLSVSPVLAGGGELGAEHATIAPEVAFLPDEPVPGVLRSARRRGSFLFLRYGLGDGAAV